MKRVLALIAAPLLLLGAIATTPAFAGSGHVGDHESNQTLKEAYGVVQQMQKDPDMRKLLKDAKGVFIVPDYAKGALGVGARGGEGVMLAHRDGAWSNPVFFNFGGISVGAEAGFEAGQIAMVLTNDRGVRAFESGNNFSLNADSGFTIIDWSARAQGSLGKGGDVVVWSDSEGVLAGADFSITDIRWDQDENEQFYGRASTTHDIVTAQRVDNQFVKKLIQELPS